MSWYRKAQAFEPRSLEDRNLLNEKIRFFGELRDTLEKLAKVVFQDGMYAKDTSYKLANDKKMSSYPAIRDVLLEADRIALDSPWRFSDLCKEAYEELGFKIKQLEKQRKHLIEETMPNRMKGWVDRHGRKE